MKTERRPVCWWVWPLDERVLDRAEAIWSLELLHAATCADLMLWLPSYGEFNYDPTNKIPSIKYIVHHRVPENATSLASEVYCFKVYSDRFVCWLSCVLWRNDAMKANGGVTKPNRNVESAFQFVSLSNRLPRPAPYSITTSQTGCPIELRSQLDSENENYCQMMTDRAKPDNILWSCQKGDRSTLSAFRLKRSEIANRPGTNGPLIRCSEPSLRPLANLGS